MKEEIETIEKLFDLIIEFTVNYGFQVFGAIVILIIGVIVARWLSKGVIKLCEKRKMDITLSKFLGNFVKILVLVFVVIIAMGKFGISIAPFIALLGALAFGASFALQGPLSNYGAGLTIILARSFVVGDTITVKNVSGIVDEVTMATTILSTEDGEKITIPNKHIVGEILNNSFANRVVENTVGISYDDDPEKAINVIKETLKQFTQISSEPAPQIGIQEFADSSINVGMRYWIPTKQYFGTLYEVNLAVYKALAAAEIAIPFPQQDIHIISQPQQK
ncbi:MAG: mechanosensitive ion channel family protein [Deltaproteobacteria bacterium]|nr:mechanosensitive ion channel family protein [Deltaproteobacteria bacterium]MBW1911073.1 mechanosensitive ion channel family protein [Deltaproteobacteria bacterium]MBW2035762.1 mechanosensitive ion channel family protein [Deltaproteobacteria bacterium]